MSDQVSPAQTWFASLSQDEQHRLAPSYIAILQEQLANAHIIQKRLLSALDHFDPSYKDPQRGRSGGSRLKKTCRNCFKLSDASDVYKCNGCYNNWGCIECNTDNKLVIKCPSCHQHVCEECDIHVKLFRKESNWKCSACHYSALIVEECDQKIAKLHEGTITRNQAIVVWKAPQMLGNMVSALIYHILSKKFRDSSHWMVFSGASDVELEANFPEAEDDDAIVICPLYEQSPHTRNLVTEIVNKVFSEKDHNRYTEYIWEHLFDSFIIARTTYKVQDVLEPFLDNDDITEEEWASIDTELLNKVFN